jgi:hypothetical protein
MIGLRLVSQKKRGLNIRQEQDRPIRHHFNLVPLRPTKFWKNYRNYRSVQYHGLFRESKSHFQFFTGSPANGPY